MNMDENRGSLVDVKTFGVILLIPVLFWAWSKYLSYKYPNMNKTMGSKESVVASESSADVSSGDVSQFKNSQSDMNDLAMKPNSAGENQDLVQNISEQVLQFENEKVAFKVSSFGMGIRDFTLFQYRDRDGKNLVFGNHVGDFEFGATYNGQPIVFEISEIGKGLFRGVAEVKGVKVVRELSYDEQKNFFNSKVWVGGDGHLEGLTFLLRESIKIAKSKSIFFPSYEKQDFFIRENSKSKSLNFSEKKENSRENFQNVSIAGMSSQYFTMALLDKSEIIPEVNFYADIDKKISQAFFEYKGLLKANSSINQVLYIGPKGIEELKEVAPELSELMDFGIFGFIARPMLYLMKALFSIVGNWGFAIILLTLIVRFFVLPFNIMSYRSMKGMQKIQPMLASLRERYKEDPVTLNREMYALMREHKANPMGGCLPMLLQIPVFFALFRVIGSSVELYKSPFLGWILDLSSKDPYYIFPVLMGTTMYIQQKLTPTNMDPNQAKIMAFMPLIFSAFMFQMPSGLTLYMFVSGLFGITQQYLFMREKRA